MDSQLDFLESCHGNGTTLLTLLISAGSNLASSSQRLTSEYSLAGNIKSKQTRNSIQDAIKSAQSRLKGFKKTPDTGLALFAGYCV